VTDPLPATRGLHLLAYGELDSGVTDSLRVGVYREPLAALGVEIRTWSSFTDDLLGGDSDTSRPGSAPMPPSCETQV
jgi:hypothetical protein